MPRSDLGLQLLLGVLCLALLMFLFPSLFIYVIPAAAVAAALAALGVTVYVLYWFLHNHLSPTVRGSARVVRKRDLPWDVSIPPETPEMQAARLGMMGRDPEEAARAFSKAVEASVRIPDRTLAAGDDLYVTFFVGGREMEMLVPHEVFPRVQPGDEGLLVFRGEQFVCFAPPGTEPESRTPLA